MALTKLQIEKAVREATNLNKEQFFLTKAKGYWHWDGDAVKHLDECCTFNTTLGQLDLAGWVDKFKADFVNPADKSVTQSISKKQTKMLQRSLNNKRTAAFQDWYNNSNANDKLPRGKFFNTKTTSSELNAI